MTLEESNGVEEKQAESTERMQVAGKALEELLSSAQRQHCLTVGVYESAKVMNVDPDSVVLCLLATDEEDEGDVALQIHFTLIQAFCCDNDINIVRVNDVQRLAEIVGSAVDNEEPKDMHCILVTVLGKIQIINPIYASIYSGNSRCPFELVILSPHAQKLKLIVEKL
eukprot:g40850.t1